MDRPLFSVDAARIITILRRPKPTSGSSEIMKTTLSIKPADVTRSWHLVDADGLVLGRLASIIAMRLRGKHKRSFTPHVDCGDFVVVVNAEKVQLTGRKLTDRKFYWHTGHPRRHQGAHDGPDPVGRPSGTGDHQGRRADGAARGPWGASRCAT
jgi:ribosomal protein L13, bacterial type